MSQIATTIEQSKRLLALGVPPETADMHYYQIANLEDWVLTVGGKLGTSNDVPAWSFACLYEMAGRPVLPSFPSERSIFDMCISFIEFRGNIGLTEKNEDE
jgi:hypothetical protein